MINRYLDMRVLVALSLLLVLVSCKKSENQKATVEFSIQLKFEDTNYHLTDYYLGADGTHLRIELIQFYLADLRFVNQKGKEIPVSDIVLVKFDLTGSADFQVKVPAGDYSSIRFGVGVPAAMNSAGPAAYNEADHPLSSTQNTYWGMNSMYRFVMLDGKYDLTGDGIDEGGFSYHTGFNECYREVELVHDFSFKRKETYTQSILLDVSKLFDNAGNEVNITVESNFHGDYAALDLAMRISNNFAASLFIP